jgi:hypothetical protein
LIVDDDVNVTIAFKAVIEVVITEAILTKELKKKDGVVLPAPTPARIDNVQVYTRYKVDPKQ